MMRFFVSHSIWDNLDHIPDKKLIMCQNIWLQRICRWWSYTVMASLDLWKKEKETYSAHQPKLKLQWSSRNWVNWNITFKWKDVIPTNYYSFHPNLHGTLIVLGRPEMFDIIQLKSLSQMSLNHSNCKVTSSFIYQTNLSPKSVIFSYYYVRHRSFIHIAFYLWAESSRLLIIKWNEILLSFKFAPFSLQIFVVQFRTLHTIRARPILILGLPNVGLPLSML